MRLRCMTTTEIRQWASKNGCEIITKHRTIGTSVELISKVVVPDESIAMRVVGRTLAAECREARRRIACLVAACDVAPETIESAARMTGHEQPDDFDLLVSAVRYFRHHDVTGMTPRQIPLTGFSGKWLNESKTNRRKAICRLLGVETLGLSKRPTELRFRYLDPVRDDAELERIIWCPWEGEALSGIKYAVIVENKDTYQTMPPIAQGICIWGSGRAVSDAVPAVPALRDMRIVYWGDMDADGLEILSTLRESGIECDSILMDCDAYDRYHRFGTDRTERSAKIVMREPKPTPGLQSAERRLYERLCADKTIAYRRIEQERIPMRDAVDELRKLGIPVESIENQDLPI
ncbi:hypothetical protein BLOI2_0412 [Bifidobacterium longum subsp. longum]|nr:hypothetical protein BLOI2_0412 [Bifidobacterium longum subsp. longum]